MSSFDFDKGYLMIKNKTNTKAALGAINLETANTRT
jgi:hypothetical protein